MSLPSFLFDTQDWQLVVDLNGFVKCPDMIQRCRQLPDIAVHSMSTCWFMLIELMILCELRMEGMHVYKMAKYECVMKLI